MRFANVNMGEKKNSIEPVLPYGVSYTCRW